jgi:YD repeat-containing protein
MSDFTEVVVGPDLTDILIVGDVTQIASVYDETVVIHTEGTVVVASDSAGPQGPPGPPANAPEDLVFLYTGDILQSVDGETFFLTFTYDLDGKLTTVTDTVSGLVKTLAYDGSDRLVSITVTP